MNRYHIFETAIGWAGLAWNDAGLIGAHLPESDAGIARASFRRRFPDAVEAEPSPAITTVAADIQALLRGEKPDLLDAHSSTSRASLNSTRRSTPSPAPSRPARR